MSTPTMQQAIDTADMDELRLLIATFRDLPEFGMGSGVERVMQLIKAADEAEWTAKSARNAARFAAIDLAKSVAENWTAREFRAATGYKP